MPEDKAMIVKMAFLYVQSGEWYKAIEEYKKLLAMDPEDPHVYNMMGDAYAKKNDDKDAFEAYQKSSGLYARLGNNAKVAAIDKKVAKLSPDRLDLQQKRILMTASKTQEAERLAAEGKLDEAVAYYYQLIAAEPINFSYREKLADLMLENVRISEAVAALKGIADIHLSEGRLEMAFNYADRIFEIDPEGIDTIRLLASIAEKKGDREAVKNHSTKLAQVAFNSGLYEEARVAIEKAAQAGNSDLKLLMAKTLMGLKKPAEAKAQFEALLTETPGDEDLVEKMLTLCEETKDWNGAYTHLSYLIQKRPEDPKLQPRLARILLQVGRRPEALQIYQTLAHKALAEGKADAAFNYFDAILGLEPDNVEILKKKAEIYLKLGKKQEVIDTYKKLQAVFTQKKMLEEAKKVGLVLQRLAGMK